MKQKTNKKYRLTLFLNPKIVKKLKIVAIKKGISVSLYIEKLIKQNEPTKNI